MLAVIATPPIVISSLIYPIPVTLIVKPTTEESRMAAMFVSTLMVHPNLF